MPETNNKMNDTTFPEWLDFSDGLVVPYASKRWRPPLLFRLDPDRRRKNNEETLLCWIEEATEL